MLASSKIAILCASLGLAVPACTLVLGDFDPASTSATGGSGGKASTSITASSAGGAGGELNGATTGNGSTVTASSSSSGTAGGGDPVGSSSAGSGGATCNPPCPMSPIACKQNVCVNAACEEQDVPKDTPCFGGTCDAFGSCIPAGTSAASSSAASSSAASSSAASSSSGGGCIDSTGCPQTGNVCIQPSCVGGVCSTKFTASGTKTSSQMPGDCHVNECDGAGNIVPVVDDMDIPLPLNDCTMGACSGGAQKQVPLMADTACMSNGGKVCDGAGACVQCNVSAQCMTGMCSNHQCLMPTPCLVDQVQDGTETDIDCGGPSCQKCPPTKKCLVNADCTGNDCLMFVCGP